MVVGVVGVEEDGGGGGFGGGQGGFSGGPPAKAKPRGGAARRGESDDGVSAQLWRPNSAVRGGGARRISQTPASSRSRGEVRAAAV